MSFAYMALFTGDYLRDTRHLTPEEHGVYLLLLMHCWDQKGPVTLDERKQAGIVNARSGGELESLRRVLNEYFVRMDDGWYNRRMQMEIERAENIASARSIAGKRGYEAKSKQLPSKSQAIAKQLPLSPSPSLTSTPEKPNYIVTLARDVVRYLNEKAGKAFRPQGVNLKLIEARLKDGATVDQCKAVIDRQCKQWRHDPEFAKYLRPATLFNATKFEQYLGECHVHENMR